MLRPLPAMNEWVCSNTINKCDQYNEQAWSMQWASVIKYNERVWSIQWTSVINTMNKCDQIQWTSVINAMNKCDQMQWTIVINTMNKVWSIQWTSVTNTMNECDQCNERVWSIQAWCSRFLKSRWTQVTRVWDELTSRQLTCQALATEEAIKGIA